MKSSAEYIKTLVDAIDLKIASNDKICPIFIDWLARKIDMNPTPEVEIRNRRPEIETKYV